MASQNNDSDEERSEPASQYRREEFRKQGKVAMSRELLSVGLLVAAGACIFFASGHLFRQFSVLCETFFHFDSVEISRVKLLQLSYQITQVWAWMVIPFFATT